MTDARFTTDGGPALVLSGAGPRPASVELVGPRARVTATAHRRRQDVAGGARAARGPLGLSGAAAPRRDRTSCGSRRLSPARPIELPDPSPLDSARHAARGARRRGRAHRAADRSRVRLGRRSGRARAPLRDASGRARERGVLRELLRPQRELQPARDRPGARSPSASVSRATGASSICSVWVPDGAEPVVEGSPEWWRARGSARLLVVNDWLRRRFARRARPGRAADLARHAAQAARAAPPGFDPRRMAAVIKESRRWNVLLAQNPYAAADPRQGVRVPARGRSGSRDIPRNDVLTTGDGGGDARCAGHRSRRARAALRADLARRPR